MSKSISKRKQIAIGRLYLGGEINIYRSAAQLRISRNTLTRYLTRYKEFAHVYPEGLINDDFQMPIFNSSNYVSDIYKRMDCVLSEFLATETIPGTIKEIWLKYKEIEPDGYRYSHFAHEFAKWRKINKFNLHNRWQVIVPKDDLEILKSWRNCGDRGKWEKAVIVLECVKGTPLGLIATNVDRTIEKVRDWVKVYQAEGINGFQKKPNRISEQTLKERADKLANLIKLIHETPKLHGINRASWFLVDLSATYQKVYGNNMSMSTISEYLKKEGYVYRKAREVLTSPDPEFREKLANITNILSNLKEREKFFSVDEFGPFAVKIKGGRSLVKKGERKTFPQHQISKGFTICTAALELSANQVTHFYSRKKDTEEMIKLIDLLIVKYRTDEKLYFSWDAASWHASKRLVNHIDFVNSDNYRDEHHTPLVELAPLPASAQFLNVIESVFSGLAKSIIHNSDYGSLDECKAAIDQYFKSRNDHFIQNPHRAGNKIWGKELVVPAFKETNNCKDPKYR